VTDPVDPLHADRAQEDDSVPLRAVRALHLQCRSGDDTLELARHGTTVVGVDRSRPAILRARARATELGLADRSRFIIADLYDLRHTLPEPESFDAVYSAGGGIGRLPDIGEWARIVEWYLEPGGVLSVSDVQPAANETPVDAIVAALVDAGLVIDVVREHAGSADGLTIRAHRPFQPVE
jgi:SAM-dependent methyltransferase